MARPRKDSSLPPARARMEAAMWELLIERPLHAITVGEVVRRAGVNHNTFYYHFHSLDDLAYTLAEEFVDDAPIDRVALAFQEGAFSIARVLSENMQFYGRKKQLLALLAHGSPELISHTRRIVSERWMRAFHLEEEAAASPQAQLTFAFLTGGVATVLGEYGHDEQAMAAFAEVLDSGIAEMMLQSIEALRRGGGEAQPGREARQAPSSR